MAPPGEIVGNYTTAARPPGVDTHSARLRQALSLKPADKDSLGNAMASVYRKTEKGLAEIETRAHRLAPRLRSALIMVDGKRNDDELRKLILNDPDGALKSLLDEGYVEVISITPQRPAPPPPP